ncbi:AraC family transcriptional regulator [uncultured Clostridium sp.]|uniref:helix-turn-helix domain-containing protein n=1 Tax=uncultured Clostridium sp. TaxID=59620 RepID=UPI0028EF60C0|nr:AraC family transcriptional regulator [uncultured Clostridium sp.]
MTALFKRIVKAPKDLASITMLKLKGLSVIGACIYSGVKTGTMYLQDHVLLFVLEGTYIVRFGKNEYKVRKNEMVLLQKAIVIEYEKFGESDSEYTLDYMMFFLKDELLNEFLNMSNIKYSYPSVSIPVTVHSATERLQSYIVSLKPYFKESKEVGDELVKLKLLELLFNIVDADEKLLYQFLQLKRKEPSSIVKVIEENLMNPVSLNDLAYLSGRSLSTFKREFQAIYNEPTFQWIRNRRLEKAKELLMNSGLSVTDVCFATGFENAAHFSKSFKKKYGVPPSEVKQLLN